MSETDPNISATALKAFGVLDFVGEQRDPVSVIDVANGIGADRATAYRMLMTLVQAGYVTRDASSKNYALSFKALTLTRNLIREDERAMQIVTCIRQIAEQTGETVHYSVLERDSAVLLFRAKGTQRVSVDFQIGDRSPLPCTSIGKVLMAYQDARFVDRIIAAGLPRVAPKTICEPDELRRELSLVRAQRYAYDDMEFASDMRCMAVAVFERGGTVPGGIAISGPSSRFDLDKLEKLKDVVLPHAERLSTALGAL